MWNGELRQAAAARVRFLARLGLNAIVVDPAGRLVASGPASTLPPPFLLQGEHVGLAGETSCRALASAAATLAQRPAGTKTILQAGPACLLVLLHDRIGAASVIVAIPTDRHLGERVCPDCLRAAFGLSEREAELAAHVGAGRSLGSAAATLGISLATARTHLRHIFLKAGVESQNELVAVVAATAFGHCPEEREIPHMGVRVVHMN